MPRRVISVVLIVLLLAYAPMAATNDTLLPSAEAPSTAAPNTAALDAVPGSAADPIATKSYIDQVFLPRLLEYASSAAQKAPQTDEAFQELFRQIEERTSGLDKPTAARQVSRSLTFQAGSFRALPMNTGDTLLGGEGTQFILQSGAAQATGELIDFTAGTVIQAGRQIPTGVLLCSVSGSGFVMRTPGAAQVKGHYSYVLPPNDQYERYAEALQAMRLVSGTGSGLELTRPMTRSEGISLMLILFGEGAAAQSYTGPSPFKDIEGQWAERYIAYAYSRGYTSGTSAATFSPDDFFSADMFVTLVLAALGHDKSSDFHWTGALEYATANALLTSEQIAPARDFFNRDQLMHIAYQTLSATFKDSGETVLERLILQGVVDPQIAEAAIKENVG